MFSHPATQFTCRHCRADAGFDPEVCFHCGPICTECFARERPEYPCPAEAIKQSEPEVPAPKVTKGKAK